MERRGARAPLSCAARSSEPAGRRALERLGPLGGRGIPRAPRTGRPDLCEALEAVYGDAPRPSRGGWSTTPLEAATARSLDLRVLDRRREVDPRWFLSEQMIGYVAYADRFAGDLDGVRRPARLPRRARGPLPPPDAAAQAPGGGERRRLRRRGLRRVDPRLGTMADLESLAGRPARQRGIALCVDSGAQPHRPGARSGPGRRWPATRRTGASTASSPTAPSPTPTRRRSTRSSPTWRPGASPSCRSTGEWVWTTFHEFQWDLNWENPDVFRAMLGVLFSLANHGIDVVRLDAVPFLWKRKGTDCLNQPEAHRILQALRALTRLAMPGVVLKAEAIVGPGRSRALPGRARGVPARVRSCLRQPADGDALVGAGHPGRAAPGCRR